MPKEKFSVSMDPELVSRIDAVAEARGDGRATVIERLCRVGIDDEEKFLRELEDPVRQTIYQALGHPAIMRMLVRVVGENMTAEEVENLSASALEQIVRGKSRGAKRSTPRRSKGAMEG